MHATVNLHFTMHQCEDSGPEQCENESCNAKLDDVDENHMYIEEKNAFELIHKKKLCEALDLVKSDKSIAFKTDEAGQTLLHWACLYNAVDLCKYLVLECTADVNATTPSNQTPLMWATVQESIELMNLLISKGADVNAADYKGVTPIILAIQHENTHALLLLEHFGGDVNKADMNGGTPVNWAAFVGNLFMLKLLEHFNANFNARNKHGMLPLHMAVLSDNYEISKYLVNEHFQDGEDKATVDGETPLDLCRCMPDPNPMMAELLHTKPSRMRLRKPNLTSVYDTANALEQLPIPSTLTSRISSYCRYGFNIIRYRVSGTASMDYNDNGSLDPTIDSVKQNEFEMNTMMWLRSTVKSTGRYVLSLWSMGLHFEERALPFIALIIYALCLYCWITQLRSKLLMMASTTAETSISFIMSLACSFFDSGFPIFVCCFIWLIFADPGMLPIRHRPNSAVEKIQSILADPNIRVNISDLTKDKSNVKTINGLTTSLADSIDLNRLCTTCWVKKGLRTKHCRECDRCVDIFDHHCVWIGNCVGWSNHRLFILWLLFCLVIQTIHFAVCGTFLFTEAYTAAINDDGRFRFISFVIGIISFPINTFVFCGHVPSYIWIVFLLYKQLKSIATNITSNEIFFMSRYSHFWITEEILSIDGQLCTQRVYRNPFNKGILENCRLFWSGKRRDCLISESIDLQNSKGILN